MVYRGKPSAGCENCRKAKKRCGLEQPSCQRCVKLKKTCSGYRDTTSLQIQDESESVKRKAERQKTRPPPQSQQQFHIQSQHQTPKSTDFIGGIPTPGSTSSDSTSSSDNVIIDFDFDMTDIDSYASETRESRSGSPGFGIGALTACLKPAADDVATTYFFKNFTSNNHWDFMRMFGTQSKMDPCLELAIKACGMAALDNIENVVFGKDYARSMYVEALGFLNEALRDPTRSKSDESLIAVSMLGYYENLTCDGKQSIQSWKAHVKGATQLLKLRGKSQFKTMIGRILFRETRNQIMINSLWDDERPPQFLWEYQEELLKCSIDQKMVKPIDDLTSLCFDFAVLRAELRYKEITDAVGAEQASELERRFLQWQIDTLNDRRWQYHDVEVSDSEHVWDGMVHAYSGLPVPMAWNTYRSMRIMLSRTQEMLCRRFQFSESEREEQMQYFRKTRRQLTDEICAGIPSALGHASPAFSSPCVLISAYGSIWPLFFAGTCTLERVGPGAYSILKGEPLPPGQMTNKAAAQATWVLGRLDYISKSVGLKWADGVAATLRGDFKVPDELLAEDEKAVIQKYPKIQHATWLRQIEDAHRGARFRSETANPLSEALAEESKNQNVPIWLGRAAGPDTQRFKPPEQAMQGLQG